MQETQVSYMPGTATTDISIEKTLCELLNTLIAKAQQNNHMLDALPKIAAILVNSFTPEYLIYKLNLELDVGDYFQPEKNPTTAIDLLKTRLSESEFHQLITELQIQQELKHAPIVEATVVQEETHTSPTTPATETYLLETNPDNAPNYNLEEINLYTYMDSFINALTSTQDSDAIIKLALELDNICSANFLDNLLEELHTPQTTHSFSSYANLAFLIQSKLSQEAYQQLIHELEANQKGILYQEIEELKAKFENQTSISEDYSPLVFNESDFLNEFETEAPIWADLPTVNTPAKTKNALAMAKRRIYKKRHQCTVKGCGKWFTTPKHLEIHKRTHTGECPFKCDECNKKFKTKNQLTVHKQTHRNYRPFVCTYPGCSKTYTRNEHLKIHMQTHTGERPYKCCHEGCNRTFTRKDHRDSHEATHEEGKFICNQCGQKFHRQIHLDSHMLSHSLPDRTPNPDRIKCPNPDCNSTFTCVDSLKMHIKTQHESQTKNYICDFIMPNGQPCGKAFYTSSNLKEHKLSHSDAKPFKCTYEGCNKTYKTKKDLTRHIREKHTEKPDEFTCDFIENGQPCGKKFTSQNGLTRHIKTVHTQERTYKCNYCDELFYTASERNVHENRWHNEEGRKYNCRLEGCNESFYSSSDRNRHERTVHSDERNYKCDHDGCTSCFKTQTELTAHKKNVHLEVDQMFICDWPGCNMSFPTENRLKEHYLRHSGERPHQCHYCDRCFFTTSDRAKHERRAHTDEKPYKCRIDGCNASFFDASDRNRHEKNIHSDARPFVCKCGSAYKTKTHLKRHQATCDQVN